MKIDYIRFKQLIVWVLVVIGFLSLFFFSVKEILTPFVLFILAFYLLHPYLKYIYVRQIFILICGLFALWFLAKTAKILTPFIVAAVFSYLLSPLVAKLEKKNFPRTLAIVTVIVPFIVVVILGLVLLIPYLGNQLSDFMNQIPNYLNTIISKIEVLVEKFKDWNLPIDIDVQNIERVITSQGNKFLEQLPENLVSFGKGVGAVIQIISYIIIVPIMTFYILKDLQNIKKFVKDLIPRTHLDSVVETVREMDFLVGKYIRGQIIVAFIIGTLSWLGLWIVGVDFALVLGAISGIFNIVPYFGLVVSIVPAYIVAIATGDSFIWAILKVSIVYAIIHNSDGAFITPKIMSKEVGLPPLIIILSIFISGYFMGVVGVLIAVPLAAILTYFFKKWKNRYTCSDFYQSGKNVENKECLPE